jgi:Uma2 family endonuclease
MFVSNKNTNAFDDDVLVRAPELVVEILSPSTMADDRHRKRKLYERFGVKEYWLIDPKNQSIEVLELMEGGYDIVSFAVQKGTIRSTVLEGFTLDLKDVF